MKPEERTAKLYLESLHRGSVIYEPIKNSPPDFLVDGTLAVEVRRLNLNEVTEAGYRGFEETRYPLTDQVSKLLASFGPPKAGASWFVSCRFRRPLPEWKTLRLLLRSWLASFRSKTSPTEGDLSAAICDNFEIELLRSSHALRTFFVLGSFSDHDTGVHVLSATQRNLLICIEEKTRKIAPVRDKFLTWWLILVDTIGYGGWDNELFREYLRFKHNWDKIILLIPLDLSTFDVT